MKLDTDHVRYEDYKPTPKQKKCKHKKFTETEGCWPDNRLGCGDPDFYYHVCNDCGARGYDGLWVVKRYVDSDAHDFCYGHSKEECTSGCKGYRG